MLRVANSVMDALKCLPARDQLRDWPKIEEALDHLDNALIDLSKSGVEIEPRPSMEGQ